MANPQTKHAQEIIEDEIYADLVETLFKTTGSFLAGIGAGLLAPTIAWLSTGDFVYLCVIFVMLALSLYRVNVLVAYQKTSVTTRRANTRYWEIRYAIGGIAFMTAVGVSAAILFTYHHNQMLAYYGVILMTGCAGALASRNAGRPAIVLGQVLGACAPLAVTALLNFDAWYWGLALILIFGMISVKSTTKFLHATLEAALRNGHDAQLQRQRLSLALNSMTHGLCMGQPDMMITVLNRRVFEFFGIVAATTPIRLDALAASIAAGGQMTAEEARAFVARWKSHAGLDRATVFSQQIGARIFDFRCEPAKAGGFVTVIEDVTVARRALRNIERIAHYDDLTGLPNRFQFQNRLARELRHAIKQDKTLTLLSVDLDYFKEVNDALGHAVGDQLLIAVAQRLRACARPGDVTARFGGDEFSVLLAPSENAEAAEAAAKSIIDALSAPYVIDNHTLSIGASIGMAQAPRDAKTVETLFRCGDLALYRSKACGRGAAVWYEPRMHEALLRKRRVEEELRRALEREELVLFYQPIVDARRNVVTCLEALVRWRHPERGLVPPGEFIPVAEETGLIIELGEWVLRRACRDARAFPEHVRVAVNVSPRQFQQTDIAAKVREALAETGLAADRLELEITETTLLHDGEEIERKIREVDALGARLSLDDFGTGYSSLCHLDRFPVKKVKIDRSFSKKMLDSPKSLAIVEAIALLARQLDIDLVVEGVETNAQVACLAGKNIFLIQGYFYSPPKPIEEIAGRLAQWHATAPLEAAA